MKIFRSHSFLAGMTIDYLPINWTTTRVENKERKERVEMDPKRCWHWETSKAYILHRQKNIYLFRTASTKKINKYFIYIYFHIPCAFRCQRNKKQQAKAKMNGMTVHHRNHAYHYTVSNHHHRVPFVVLHISTLDNGRCYQNTFYDMA